jgi:hypothetical protein
MLKWRYINTRAWNWNPPGSQSRRRVIKTRLFNLIRRFFVADWDRNEDYICGNCGEPVLKRYLYCSLECKEHHHLHLTSNIKYEEEGQITANVEKE